MGGKEIKKVSKAGKSELFNRALQAQDKNAPYLKYVCDQKPGA